MRNSKSFSPADDRHGRYHIIIHNSKRRRAAPFLRYSLCVILIRERLPPCVILTREPRKTLRFSEDPGTEHFSPPTSHPDPRTLPLRHPERSEAESKDPFISGYSLPRVILSGAKRNRRIPLSRGIFSPPSHPEWSEAESKDLRFSVTYTSVQRDSSTSRQSR